MPRGSQSAAAEIARLRDELERHNYLYYVLDQPEISDSEYDAKMRRLVELEAAHPELADASSPTQRVGAAPSERFGKVRHTVPMLSLDNAMSREEVEQFEARIRRFLSHEGPIEYVAEHKLDGVAVELVYEHGSLHAGLDSRRRHDRRRHHREPEDRAERSPAAARPREGPARFPSGSRSAARSSSRRRGSRRSTPSRSSAASRSS